MKSLISVIIPAYNHEKYIAQTIMSIIDQSYKNLELIIIDDGSSDNTWKIIKSLKEQCLARFTKVEFITQKNQGICATLNKLISLTSGEYIYMIASDDMAKPNAIELLYEELVKNTSYIVAVGDSEIIDENSKKIAWDIAQNPVDIDNGYVTFWQYFVAKHPRLKAINENMELFGTYKTLRKGNYIPNGSLIISKMLKKAGPFTNKAPLEDWYIHLQLSKLGKYKFVNQILFSYRWHSHNTIKNKRLNKIKIMKTKIYEFHKRVKFIIGGFNV
ncbi:glycosyltransferase family 2 protein [Campylobacter devanensis]|uniref:glycosyltransferase family 2 protein n=1 Tax=Campylobacter devanensis TaxID=3161138 RepID=UPI000A3568D4|nr:glycosyltransferase family 2 protein [Campylobacter sp. P093]